MFTLHKLIDWLFSRGHVKESVPNLVIRAATLADAEAIVYLRKAADKDRGNRNPPLDPYGGQNPTIAQQIEDIVKFSESGLFLIAEVGKEITGIAFAFEMHATVGDYRLRLVMDRKWRRKGIGTALASYVVAWAKEKHSVKKIVCAFEKSHKDAKHMFIKLGFNVQKQGWAWYMQGARYNQVEMALNLP